MQARQKPLTVETPSYVEGQTTIQNFEKPQVKGPVKLVDAADIDTLIELLQNEAKVL